MKKAKNIIFRSLVLGFTLVLVFVSPYLTFLVGDDLNLIYSTFIGKKSEYQGIIEVWNVDSFESGTVAKTAYIEKLAQKFQRENKGTYVVIRDLTQSECANLLASGEKPDVFSCSYGVADEIKEHIKPFKNIPNDVGEVFLNAGKTADKLYALAWCVGYYTLISTKAKLEKAGFDVENVELNKIAYDADYEYKSGKNNKKSASVAFGTGLHLMPKNSLIAYNKARSIQITEKAENELKLKTGYSAYCSFLANDATILLGTQRDIFRMSAREEKGKVSDVIYQPLNNWTDLVQFAFVTKKGENNQNEIAEKFALTLTNKDNQRDLETIGMFPVVRVFETSYKGIMRDIILDNFSVLSLNSVY